MRALFAPASGLSRESPGVRFYVVFSLLQVLATGLGLHLTWNSDALPLVWPTAGVLYAALLVSHSRHWLAIAGLGVVLEVSTGFALRQSHDAGGELLRSLFDVGITACQAIFATWIVKQLGGARREPASTVDDFVIGLVAAAFSAAAGSVGSVFAGLLVDDIAARWPTMVVWWSADFFAMSVLAPALVPMLRRAPPVGAGRIVPVRFARELLEFLLVVACVVTFVGLLLGGAIAGDADRSVLNSLLVPVLPWPPLLWLALRNPPWRVALANAVRRSWLRPACTTPGACSRPRHTARSRSRCRRSS